MRIIGGQTEWGSLCLRSSLTSRSLTPLTYGDSVLLLDSQYGVVCDVERWNFSDDFDSVFTKIGKL